MCCAVRKYSLLLYFARPAASWNQRSGRSQILWTPAGTEDGGPKRMSGTVTLQNIQQNIQNTYNLHSTLAVFSSEG